MAKKKVLPKEIYVRWYQCRNEDEPFLEANEDNELLCDHLETERIGVYRLQRVIKVKNETTVVE